jgi:hypothetical protein
MLCVCVSPPINFQVPEPIFIKLGMYIMACEPISTVYFINPSHQTVCLCVSPVIARQWLDTVIAAAMNTHATIAEFVHTLFPVGSTCMLYQGK